MKCAEAFGKFLLRVRDGLQTSQAQMAPRLGVDASTLARLEGGEANVSVEVVDQILGALGMDAAALCRSLLAHELRKRGRPPSVSRDDED